jgi:hypothetical protein
VEMLTLVLKNNSFTFDGNHYLQINGTAMGTKMAPSYANIFMGDLEEQLLLSSLKQPLSWFRFIDDVDMKWTHGDKELDEFLEHANSIHPSINFSLYSRRSFLLISLAFENPLSITLSLYPRFFK